MLYWHQPVSHGKSTSVAASRAAGLGCQDLRLKTRTFGQLFKSITVLQLQFFFFQRDTMMGSSKNLRYNLYYIYKYIYIYIYNTKFLPEEGYVRGKNCNCNNCNAFLAKIGDECEKVFHIQADDTFGEIADLSVKITKKEPCKPHSRPTFAGLPSVVRTACRRHFLSLLSSL